MKKIRNANDMHRLHTLIPLVVLLPFLLLCLLTLRNPHPSISYPLDNVAAHTPYVQQTDAFLKGQAEIDLSPASELIALENPYDPDARANIPTLWDRAYYDGHYYSYFGIAPVLTVYLPYYAIFGALPHLVTVCVILAAAATIFSALAYREFLLRFCPRANMLLAAIGLASFLCSSGILFGIAWRDTYYVAVLSALGALMSFLFFFFRALRTHGFAMRTLLFAASGIALVLTVWSRPTVALMSTIVLPAAYQELRLRKSAGEHKPFLLSSTYLFLTLAFGAALTMWYNHLRFDSVFEFGAKYQLTVSDVSQNRLRFSAILPAIFSYFLQPPDLGAQFPYLKRSFWVFTDAAHFVYRSASIGALWFGTPVAALTSWGSRHIRRRSALFATLLCTAGFTLFVCLFDYCLGGVNLRYLLDFLPYLALTGTIALLTLCEPSNSSHRTALAVASVLFIIGILLPWGACVNIS